MIQKPQLVNETIAAEFIGMSVAFLQAGRSRGVVGNATPSPPFLKLGSFIRYDVKDLEKWLLERRVDPAARKAAATQAAGRGTSKSKAA